MAQSATHNESISPVVIPRRRRVAVGRAPDAALPEGADLRAGTVHGDTLIPARSHTPEEDALARTLRRWATPKSVDDLAARGVKTVRSIPASRLGALIEKAVNRALIERTLEGGSEDISEIARRQFLRLAKDASREDHAAASAEDAELRGRATSTLDRLKRELGERRRGLEDHERELEKGDLDASEDARLTESVRELFGLHGDAASPQLCGQTVDLVVGELRRARGEAREARLQEHQREVRNLERRIAKLSVLLGETEDALRKARFAGTAETGIGSIYDEVQGLDSSDAQLEQKSALMKSIFEANLALR
ncbi:MAG: hypothetical protein VX015_04145 [Planctomycetota bacterium]|nr:hypothetical protein [Planctomycetota bacterium]